MSVDDSFAEYVNGRTIAIVGPAPLEGDQTGDIEAHDIVYVVTGHVRAHDVRADIVFLNANGARHYRRHGSVPYEPDWIVTKQRRLEGPNIRAAVWPRGINPNQVVIALHDLTFYEPADVKVYGADFYLGGPTDAYVAPVKAEIHGMGFTGIERVESAIRAHDQTSQRRVVRRIIADHGWPSGDSRYVTAAMMTDNQYRAAYAQAWRHPDAARAWETV